MRTPQAALSTNAASCSTSGGNHHTPACSQIISTSYQRIAEHQCLKQSIIEVIKLALSALQEEMHACCVLLHLAVKLWSTTDCDILGCELILWKRSYHRP